ncbi:hypothetical protein BFP97_03350 [Roseivirga sp. 4D4]|uniref:putative signal transducing protein n=1 Tax=Roseivirga sp. 4D4 TaxID=1889784 RepID=UPI000852E206|nr:DUF2007 domain-containing protein [Roseivirga sp. 4D4]OEK00598.1 hypothetical protein BFP97_03350 [Roseivirga sp. 4D4]
MAELTLIFEGTDFESKIVKGRLEDAGIKSLTKSETNAGLISGFGSVDVSRVFVNPADVDKASELIEKMNSDKEA